jgi:hypothetical protein
MLAGVDIREGRAYITVNINGEPRRTTMHHTPEIFNDTRLWEHMDHALEEELLAAPDFQDVFDESECVRPGFYVVTWPEHVITPHINSDCTIHGPFATIDEARERANSRNMTSRTPEEYS